MGKSQELYDRAKKIIPGGTQLLSKRPEMFLPDLWPAYYEKAKGCEIWDLDGHRFIDMSYMGIGACVLGYADDDVDGEVIKAINKGSMTTLNPPEEVELAELLIALHPWAEMARFARTGGEAMAVAVRIARASARKDKVLFCGYHGWHDWYLSANLADDSSLDGHLLPGLDPLGVPRALKGTAVPFRYNDTEGFLRALKENRGELAGVVMEPVRNEMPNREFISTIRQKTSELGIALIVDEITAGWRLNNGGAHLVLGIAPDIAVFGKGMSNGYPIAAIIGRGKVMQAAQETFISSTYWTDRVGPVAALAAIRKMIDNKVCEHLIKTGETIKDGWAKLGAKHGLKLNVQGISPLGHFSFVGDNPLANKTLFTQLMLEKGFLATNAAYASFAHKPDQVVKYLKAVDEVFGVIGGAAAAGGPEKLLKGSVCHGGFSRLN